MKQLTTLILITLFAMTGNAGAATLDGTWSTMDSCVPGNDPADPTNPKEETGTVTIVQKGAFFLVNGICGGVIDGKKISMTCPPTDPLTGTGTIFQGELKGKNEIIGINHIPDDGATCASIAIRE
jgi:hypothetical protein